MKEEEMKEEGTGRVLSVRELSVEAGQKPERIDRWLTHRVAGATRNKVQEAIVAGAVTVNALPTKANYKVRPGDIVRLELMKPPPIELVPQDIPLDILYEDDDVLVVNKPAGMVTHPGFGNRDGTLVNAVLFHVGGTLPGPEEDETSKRALAAVEDEEDDEEEDESLAAAPFDYDAVRPGVVHRLDKETSGVMVVAKTGRAKASLGDQFAARTIRREYRAIAWGVIDAEEGDIEGNIARDPRDRKRFAVSQRDGKYALTHYRVLERFRFATYLSLRLATGRTHQIRVHSAHIGHPLVGDPTYGGDKVRHTGPGGKSQGEQILKKIGRQALHARTLGFRHPVTGEYMEFSSDLPQDMERLLFALRSLG